MQSLTIGLSKEEWGWIQILNQEGLPYQRCEFKEKIDPKDLGVLILNRTLKEMEKEVVKNYLHEGGALLTDLKSLSQILPLPIQSCKIHYILSTRDPLWRDLSLIDLELNGFWTKEASLGRINGKTLAIYRAQIGRGYLLAIPFHVHEAISDQRSKRKSFYSEGGKRFPDERVSLVSKGDLRRLVSNCLKELFHKRSLPYLHLSYYPDGHRNALIFRMDTDLSDEKDIQNLYELAIKQGIRISWFINVKQGESFLEAISQMAEKGQEIGVHGYLHRTFPDYERNLANIRKARDRMREKGLHPIGFSSPYGIWNLNLGRVLEDLEFEYSSEFGLGYDDLPYYPVMGNRLSTVLQIPVHPVSTGNLRLAHFQEDEMKGYYQRVMDLKWVRGDPLFFYSHPGQGEGEVFESMVRHAKERVGIWRTDFSSFARWWKEREKFLYSAELEGNRLFIHSSSRNQRIFVELHSPEGKVALIPAREVIGLKEIPWEPAPEGIEMDEKVLKTKKTRGWLLLRDLESWTHRNWRKEF